MNSDDTTFLGLTKTKFVGLMAVLVCLATVLLTATFIVSVRTTSDDINRNQKTLAYLCSTTQVLDKLTVAASAQIQENFDNGTYYKLEQQGIVSPANIIAARKALVQYEAAHELLSSNGACRG